VDYFIAIIRVSNPNPKTVMLRPFVGLINPKTQKATAFYALLGALCADIWHRGFNTLNLSAAILFAGLGSLSAIAGILTKDPPPSSPPEDKKT